jgi:SAM-dependent methyltransferase
MLFNLEVDQFCGINWSYNSDYRTILGITDSRYFPIDRCLQCGFIYARLLPSAEFLNKIYEGVINGKIAEKASWNLQDLARRLGYIEKLFCLMLDHYDRAILDFGCGFGATSRLLADCGLKTVAYDPSRIRVETVKKRCAEALVTCDLKDLEENGPYTGIILDNVLEHVPDPDAVIQFISELMVHGAIAYLSVPSYEEADIRRLKREIQRHRSSEMTLNPWEHLNYFDVEHLDGLMKKYDVVPLKGCELPGPVEIGLRPETLASRRRRNSMASAYRLLRYAISGTAVDSVCERFYRYTGK